jgi:NAD-dependent dihydropyrimidine dehydrogenase PreA subunit
MYNSTFQVSYRRKVYEEVATLAYQRMNKEAFKWLPDWIVSVTGGNDAKEDIFSDLDYAAELCSAALGMEPSRYLDILADKTPLEQTNDPAAPMVCVLSTMCHKCTQTQDAAPCLSACANHAIKLDATGRATINPSACSSCGTCVGVCPQGAITDKSSLYQVIRAIGDGHKVMALLMPGLSEQFAETIRKEHLTSAFRMLGFCDVFEIGSMTGPHSYLSTNPERISQEIYCMNAGIKAVDKDTLVVLVAPSTMSKLDAFHSTTAEDVDYVLTLEEVLGMLDARGLCNGIMQKSDEEPLKYTREDHYPLQYNKEEGVTIDHSAAKMCS